MVFLLDIIQDYILERIKYSQSIKLEFFPDSNKKSFLKEFGTFSINAGRRSGHTYLAKSLLKTIPNSIMIVPKAYYKINMPTEEYLIYKDRLFSNKEFYGKCRDKIVIVDMTFWLSQNDKEKIYDEEPLFVIFLE